VPMAHVNAFVEEMSRAACKLATEFYGGAMHGFTHEKGPYIRRGVQRAGRCAVVVGDREFFAEIFGLGKLMP